MRSKIKVLASILRYSGLKKEAEEVLGVFSGPKKLYVFDFDGTLFRSPTAPALWRGGWWGKEASLSPPCVPERPEEDWWISEVVSEARSVRGDPSAISVMMTGRGREVFSARVSELLSGAGLIFDEVILSDSYDTVSFKSKEISFLIKNNPTINYVKIFDDRPGYLSTYSSLISSINPNIEVETVLVAAASKGVLCDEEAPEEFDLPKKTPLVGIFLDSTSKGILFEKYPAIHDNFHGNYIPVIRKPTKEQLAEMKDGNLLGKKIQIKVVGEVKDNFGQAVKIEAPEVIFPEGVIPHILISTAQGVSESYSTELLAKEKIIPDSGLTLSGIMWWK